MIPRLELPPSRAVLVLVALAFALPGLVGHDPWKSFDAIAIEIVSQMHRTGDWLVPRIAGEPWIEDPPFYHWVALAFAKAFGWLLPLHGAVRLASGFFVLAALWFVYLAARHSAPPAERRATAGGAVLVLAGSIGLIVHAHEAVTDLAALAAACAAFVFLSRAEHRPLAAGIGLGASLGIALLSAGPVTPAVLGLAVLAAHLACRPLRTPRALPFLGATLAAGAVVAASWPLVLAARAPDLAAQWWSLVTQPRGAFLGNLRYYAVTASWFTWPAWPLALWALWSKRTALLEPRMFVPLAALVLALGGIALAGPQQDINCVVLLPPLALLAAQGIGVLRRGAANALDWFGVMTFSFFAALVWLGYVAMMTGVPARIAKNFTRAAPGFAPQFELFPVLVALALLLGWMILVGWTRPAPTRGVLRWAGGVALLWGSFATLWLPWADYQKSYRAVALQLRSKLPPQATCVARSSLGSAQRAALGYHAEIRTQPFDRSKPAACPFVIVQGDPRHERDAPGAGWVKLADVGRPHDRNERFRLYQYRP
ncbi:MAG: hypothetical protein HYX46_12175 [Betaproteobacteria bacterium]|nr:hypothetical protein [Betaproteobacteria bacterium]